MGVIVETIGIHPTPHNPNMDSSADRTDTEVGQCINDFLGTGVKYGT